MHDHHLIIIIGGGLAGLSAGCYARQSGYRTTVIEHNLALGGVCNAWSRDPYVIDGCIHWLTGGPFDAVYRELGILPRVAVRPLETWVTWRDARDGAEVVVGRDLDALFARLAALAPEDEEELRHMRRGSEEMLALTPPLDAPELNSLRDTLRQVWEMRTALPTLVHFRKPMGVWARQHLKSARLRALLATITPETAPALFWLMVLGYLERGWLSRPVGGTAAFRDALERSYRELGGEVLLHATVDEVLVEGGRAVGVRLTDGTMRHAHAVISTASAPETVLRLLGGRYDAAATRERLERWQIFDPIVLASFGVAEPYAEAPALQVIAGLPPFEVGGRSNEHLYVRVCNDDPCFAPPGHTVVQAMVATDYEWWATRGTRYGTAKDQVAEELLGRLAPHFPGIREAVRVTDIATPLTFWSNARSWRGAYEGWMPRGESLFGHMKKTLAGLEGFFMAGQWVEPGGGVPTACMSGRHVVQLLCEADELPFIARRDGERARPPG